ncbi:MAG TPA: type II 3-dehydroquinate dehydratase [Alphaproteobacteria bacterium]|jgi:3-dehydroquinate dehydratase-2|nr:type II 3-dehydroquinate dehydratase [Alphaproteobacteria bacterium]
MKKPASGRTILIINGPNLNLLGTREPEIYGRATLADIEKAAAARAGELGFRVDFRQSNSESELVSWVQESRTGVAGIIVNAGAYTHTSIALLDALNAVEVPVVEVHLSNIFRRESFRHHSYVSQAATGMVAGLGAKGYELAVDAIAHLAGPATGAKRRTPPSRSAKTSR